MAKVKKSPKKKATKKRASTSKRKASARTQISLADIWPQERDFMERPDRYKYVRKIVVPKGCVFCEAAKKQPSFDSLVLYRDSLTMVMLNKFPYNNGHLLVLPVRHVGHLLELSEEENQSLSSMIRTTLAALEKTYGCPGFNIGMNHGAVAGAGIPDHLHWHVVPRWNGDTNFFPLIAETKVLAETLEQTYSRLLPYFEEQS